MKGFDNVDYELEIKRTKKRIVILSLFVLVLTVCCCGFFVVGVPRIFRAMDKALVCSRTGMSVEEYDNLIAMAKESESK